MFEIKKRTQFIKNLILLMAYFHVYGIFRFYHLVISVPPSRSVYQLVKSDS